MSQASVAQQAKNNTKLMDYSAKGGEVCQAIAKQSKPEGMSDEDFARKVNEEKSGAQNSCDFLETSGFNVITSETDPKSRMAEIEKFTAAYPRLEISGAGFELRHVHAGSGPVERSRSGWSHSGKRFLRPIQNRLPRCSCWQVPTETIPSRAAPPRRSRIRREPSRSRKQMHPTRINRENFRRESRTTPSDGPNLKQEKTAAAIPELKAAAVLLKGQDDQQYARALYGLGFAYGKLNKLTEAREVLTEAVKISGPLQPMSQDLLAKVNSARAKGK